MKRTPKSSAAPRKRCQLGISLSLEDYAAFAALAAQENRKPGALGGIAIREFLARRRSSAASRSIGTGCPSPAPAPDQGEKGDT